jgi:hypothetical protein
LSSTLSTQSTGDEVVLPARFAIGLRQFDFVRSFEMIDGADMSFVG